GRSRGSSSLTRSRREMKACAPSTRTGKASHCRAPLIRISVEFRMTCISVFPAWSVQSGTGRAIPRDAPVSPPTGAPRQRTGSVQLVNTRVILSGAQRSRRIPSAPLARTALFDTERDLRVLLRHSLRRRRLLEERQILLIAGLFELRHRDEFHCRRVHAVALA